eukprot:TRINITY_DN1124_c0_g1_i1.p1 TRINITY_DN1124_c0_g1~~TRINITY_DN1124_c0_g1_i1.p1  ORF type:complete len:101 (-),score=6.39 TRINITY_DN1124_c0_g1_i1:485-787(-)
MHKSRAQIKTLEGTTAYSSRMYSGKKKRHVEKVRVTVVRIHPQSGVHAKRDGARREDVVGNAKEIYGKEKKVERWCWGVGTARVHCVVRWRHKGIGGVGK